MPAFFINVLNCCKNLKKGVLLLEGFFLNTTIKDFFIDHTMKDGYFSLVNKRLRF